MELSLLVETVSGAVIHLGLKAALLIGLAGLATRLLSRRPAWSSLLWTATLGAVALLPMWTAFGPSLGALTPYLHLKAAPLPHLETALVAPVPTVPPPFPAASGTAWWQWAVAGLYLAGLLVALARLGTGLWRLQRLRQSVHLVDGGPVQGLSRQLGLSRPVQLGLSPLLQTPVLLGWRRPLIALPATLYAQCRPGALQDIIVHELAHLKRRDPLFNLLGQLVVSLYWFHPMVRWAARAFIEVRECACDDWVVDQGGDPLCYAETLLKAAADQRPSLALAMARTGHVAKRVERLLDPSHLPRPRVPLLMGGGVALLVLALAGCMGGLGRSGERPAPRVEKGVIVLPAGDAADSAEVQMHAIGDSTDSPQILVRHFGKSGLAATDSVGVWFQALDLPEGADFHMEVIALPGHASADSVDVVRRVMALSGHADADSVEVRMWLIEEEGDSAATHLRQRWSSDEIDTDVLMVYSATPLDTIVHRKAMHRLHNLDSTLMPLHARAALYPAQSDSLRIDFFSLPTHLSLDDILKGPEGRQFQQVVFGSSLDTLSANPTIVQKTVVVQATHQPPTQLVVGPYKALSLNGKAIALDDLEVVLSHLHNRAPRDHRLFVHTRVDDAELLGQAGAPA